MKTFNAMFRGMGGMLFHPRRSARELAADARLRPVATLVIAFGLLLSLGFLVSYLKHDYPPPPEVLDVWVAHWGERVMLPFFNLPPENYRGFQAAIMLPFALALWMLMAGTARLLAVLFDGKHSYETYLRLTGFTYFTIGLIAAFLDFLYSGVFSAFVLDGLRGAYGPLVEGLLQAFMPLEYTFLYGLLGVNTVLAVREIEAFPWWQAALVGLAVFAWPMALVASVLR